MRKLLGKVCKHMWGIWAIWGLLLTGRELIRLQIPMTLYLYEEEATEVLSGSQSNIDPQKLYLDFAGDVNIVENAGGGYQAVCNLFGMIPVKTMEVEVVSHQEVIPGGIPVGIYIQTDGVFVIGTGDIETQNGLVESPAKNIVKTGDYILSVQGRQVRDKESLIKVLEGFTEDRMILKIRRNQEEIEVAIEPILENGGAKIGVWVRDDTQGVGTLTYVTADQRFGALGHGILDSDSELLMEVSGGKLYDCEIVEIIKGERGNPGKLFGKIIYSNSRLYGEITGNSNGGIYGTVHASLLDKLQYPSMPIALKQEIVEGEATILSAADGTLREYTVEIKKIHRGKDDVNKGMELIVTDQELLELTGGIVQGMSGSPIIQNGKIIGALTHVFVNDPTRGYGIFIENMLDAAA